MCKRIKKSMPDITTSLRGKEKISMWCDEIGSTVFEECLSSSKFIEQLRLNSVLNKFRSLFTQLLVVYLNFKFKI
jgi:transcriptional regulator NrdR family protein